MVSHHLYLWDLSCYIWWHYMHCKRHHIHYICNIRATVSLSSHPFFQWYHTLYMYDITPTRCITFHTLYKASHCHFVTSHHIIYDIICMYSRHHSHDIWHCIHRICVNTTTLLMISDQLFVWHHTHFVYDILCTIHIVTSTLWTHTDIDSHDIMTTAFMTSHTL